MDNTTIVLFFYLLHVFREFQKNIAACTRSTYWLYWMQDKSEEYLNGPFWLENMSPFILKLTFNDDLLHRKKYEQVADQKDDYNF